MLLGADPQARVPRSHDGTDLLVSTCWQRGWLPRGPFCRVSPRSPGASCSAAPPGKLRRVVLGSDSSLKAELRLGFSYLTQRSYGAITPCSEPLASNSWGAFRSQGAKPGLLQTLSFCPSLCPGRLSAASVLSFCPPCYGKQILSFLNLGSCIVKSFYGVIVESFNNLLIIF